MKFGKRLAAEAARRYQDNFFDYKAVKKAIKDDVAVHDVQGTHFQRMLVSELQKVSQYYSTTAAQLEAEFSRCVAGTNSEQQLQELRGEVQELIKFVALNYLAVVKSIKKRNRHLQENFGAAANTSLHALDLLMGEVFFTSPRLANLATQAEVLSRDLQGHRHGASSPIAAAAASSSASAVTSQAQPAAAQQQDTQQTQQQLLEEYQCPVCLDTLHNPVVLTCAHRFCWGCLVAHCTACREAVLPLGGGRGHAHAHGPAGPHKDGKTSGSSSLREQVTLPSAPASSYRVLEHLASSSEPESPQFYPCPVCRKPQILDIDTLQVDTYLEQFINNLQNISNVSVSPTHQHHTGSTVTLLEQPGSKASQQQQQHLVLKRSASPQAPLVPEPWGIIPPQSPEHKGKLCVLLDLDGTLVSSFTPKRAPKLPPYVRTHVVGVGSKLNPQGVFVVERPGLTQFLEELADFAEVIVFTAGLEDYASPIIDAIDPQRRFFVDRIYREGTLRTDFYQCVKDMARLNRDLSRTVLVDDTPLAFLHQPDNGVPILGFRGDPDDRLLLEAVLPLLQALASEPDVKSVLHRRFDMGNWFKRHGFPVDSIVRQALVDAAAEREQHMAEALRQLQEGGHKKVAASSLPAHPQQHHNQQPLPHTPSLLSRAACLDPLPTPATSPTRHCCFVTDFDKTLVDFDSGERLVEQVAPELLPMLVNGTDGPTSSWLPITNTLLSEIQRRGVSRDELLATLRQIGASEVPPETPELLQALSESKVDVKVLSDANSIFITHILAGAKVAGLVQEVITNPAAFERPVGGAVSEDSRQLTGASQPSQQAGTPREGSGGGAGAGGAHKLVVGAWHGGGARPQHQCSMCPSNMCKGREVRALIQQGTYSRIVYAGDGSNDVCAALCLRPQDVVLARSGYPLARYLEQAQAGAPDTIPVQATCRQWNTHQELKALALSFTAASSPVP